MLTLSWSDIESIVSVLRDRLGIRFDRYRPATLCRRIANRLAAVDIASPADYLERLRDDPSECDRLIDAILINVSSFFRDAIVFESIAQHVLPEIIEHRAEQGQLTIRAWSAGCAAGEEAFSLSILIHRALKAEFENWKPFIFATDIDRECLAVANRGHFPEESFAETKLGDLNNYFSPTGAGYTVSPMIHNMINFSYDDLTSEELVAPADSVFGSFDLVLCRNVLIYFSPGLQDAVLGKLCRTLVPGGYLVLGESESIGQSVADRFRAIDPRMRIFQKL